jgi:hypothetical protein
MIVSDKDYVDFSAVPKSRGMGKEMIVIALLGILGIFIIGGLTVGFSAFGHVWPSEKTQRIDLGPMSH